MRLLLEENTLESTAITGQARQWVAQLTSPKTIAIFSPMANEVDLTPLVNQHPHHQWVFPRVNGSLLDFYAIQDIESELKQGTFGIMEPINGSPKVAISDIDIFFCPGLAFDPDGGRIGHGRGFYDKALAGARNDAHKIGVCFPIQLVTTTFTEKHDVKMDEIINGVT